MKYKYTIVQAPADFGKKDELQNFLNSLNDAGGEITQIVPFEGRWLLIIYRS